MTAKLCDYHIIKPLGKGSFGKVDEVERQGSQYAIKTEVFPHLDEVGIAASALREAAILSQFQAPNLLHAADIFFDCDRTFSLSKPEIHAVLPLASGDLHQWLTTSPSDTQRVKIMNDIVNGLKILH